MSHSKTLAAVAAMAMLLVGVVLVVWGRGVISRAHADFPHSGTAANSLGPAGASSPDFSISVSGVCDSDGNGGLPNTCNIASSTFRLYFNLNALPVSVTYAGYDSQIQYSGVTVLQSSLTMQGQGAWPDCSPNLAGKYFTSGEVLLGCAAVAGVTSSYTGPMWHMDFGCPNAPFTDPPTISLVHGFTDIVQSDGSVHPEAVSGSETLTIASCPMAPTHTPTVTPTPAATPGQLDFSIGIGSQCDSDSPSTDTCNITGSQYFTLDFKLNDRPFGYLGYDAGIQYSGLTVAQSSLTTQGAGAWPDCAYTGKNFSDGEVAVGCAVRASSPSYYTGPMWRIGFQCPFNPGGPANITLVHRGTDVVGTNLVSDTEPGGDETLVINCPQTAYSQSLTASFGGTLQTAFGDTLTVPPSALPSDTTMTLNIGPVPAAQPLAVVPLPRAYSFGPSGLTFLTPTTAVFSYTEVDLGSADPSSLRAYLFNTQTNSWDLLGGIVDTAAKTLTIGLNHFSTYELLRDGNVDTDGDGCPDGKEVGPNQTLGGRRDWRNPWDYFNPTRDGKNRSDDMLAVQQHYGRNAGDPGYDVKYDRTYIGPNVWNLGPPNGHVTSADMLAIQKEYGHDCA